MKYMHPAKVLTQATSGAGAVATVLWETFGQRRPADRCLSSLLRRNRHFGGRDRRLLSETVFACLRWWGWIGSLAPPRFLDAIAAAARADGESLEPKTDVWAWATVLVAAHLLEGSTAHPAVSVWAERAGIHLGGAVEASGSTTLAERWAGLVRFGGRIASGTAPIEALAPPWVSSEMSCPRPYGEFIEWQQHRPPIWLRTQVEDGEDLCGRLRREGLDVQPHGTLTEALSLREARVNLRTLSTFRRGAFEVQDLASQVIGLVCEPRPGERWWDACAGAGGKTLHLAQLMNRRGSVTASDLRVYKLKDLRLRARRSGFPNIRTREWKGKTLPERRGGFDGVLVDAPCTCSGTWRRNPDGRWTTTQADITDIMALQLRLLVNAAGAVKPGGRLVYATCSVFDRENVHVVQRFLAARGDFVPEHFRNPLNGHQMDGTLQVWPWDGDCDAMFVARFVRRG